MMTPKQVAAIRQQSQDFVEDFADDLGRSERRQWCGKYQQLKEELGLDHFEGRTWRGLHHHLTLCFLASCFLTRLRASKNASLPEVRRWLIEALITTRRYFNVSVRPNFQLPTILLPSA